METAIYLKSTDRINSGDPEIRHTAEILTENCPTDAEKARALFYFVRDEIHYNVYMISTFIDDFRASMVLSRKKGYCVQKAVLFAALLRSCGIPSRLAFARIRNHRAPAELKEQIGIDYLPSHGYAQLFLNGKWISATPAFDKPLCERIHAPTCDFDGENDALLSATDLSGNPYIEYLEKYGPEADLPFAWLYERLFPIWGEKRPWLNENDAKGHVMPLSGYRFR